MSIYEHQEKCPHCHKHIKTTWMGEPIELAISSRDSKIKDLEARNKAAEAVLDTLHGLPSGHSGLCATVPQKCFHPGGGIDDRLARVYDARRKYEAFLKDAQRGK